VPTGKYFVLALPYSKYAPAFYKAGMFGVMHWKDADTVFVQNAVSGIDIGVVQVNSVGVTSVSGQVTSAGVPVQGASVFAADMEGNLVGFGLTSDDGSYTIGNVPGGQITLSVDREGYVSAQASVSVGAMDFSVNKNFDIAGVTAVNEGPAVPQSFVLEQNYPNPFNPATTIAFSLPASSVVTIKVYSLVGQEVATLVNSTLEEGNHRVTWNGTDNLGRTVASGVYFYRFQANNVKSGAGYVSVMKMMLLK